MILFKAFISSKKARFGINAWILAESDTSYISEYSVHLGKVLEGSPHINLSEIISNFGYKLYLDIYCINGSSYGFCNGSS